MNMSVNEMLRKQIDDNAIFVVVVTSGYFKDMKAMAQACMANLMKRPVILVLFDDVENGDERMARSLFSASEILGTIHLKDKNAITDELAGDIKNIIDEYIDRQEKWWKMK